jgi:hypothetical protein
VRLNAAKEVITMPYVWEPGLILRAPVYRVSLIEHCKIPKKKKKLYNSVLTISQAYLRNASAVLVTPVDF